MLVSSLIPGETGVGLRGLLTSKEVRRAPREGGRGQAGKEGAEHCSPRRDPEGRGLDSAEPTAVPPGHDFVEGHLPQEQPAGPHADRHQPLSGL